MKAYLREWRIHLDKTQTEIAKEIGVSKGEISRLENGFRKMTTEWLTKLGDAMSIPAQALLAPPSLNGSRHYDIASGGKRSGGGFPIVSTDPEIELHAMHGDEMAPTIGPGDWVVVDKTRRSAASPGIFAVREGDDVVVRRLQTLVGGGALRVSYDNPAYPAFETSVGDVDVVGRVTYRMHRV